MEQIIKNVRGFPTPFGQGYVIDASTPEERRFEINSFYMKDWIPGLLQLNEDLEKIDPGYTLVQLKMKFGELSFYTSDLGPEGDDLIRKLSYKFWLVEHPNV